MKITSIELTNFKAIGETVVIPVKPITLIFGANSTGKSSILQCLAMLAQSVTMGKRDMSASLFGKGILVDVGNYHNFIYKHDVTKHFACKFNFDMDVNQLFDYQLPYDEAGPLDVSLNEYAEKLKNILSFFKRTALSFDFGYDRSRKTIQLQEIGYFLDDTLVFLDNSVLGFQLNTGHIFWKMYWEVFSNEIYKNLYRPSGARRRYLPDKNGQLVEQRHPQEERIRFLLEEFPNPKSIIEVYSLLNPDEPFYRQLKKEEQQGESELNLVIKLYSFECRVEDGEFTLNWISHYSGFLPSKFAFLAPEQFLCAEFIKNMNDYANVHSFHPGQLMVLVASYVESFLSSFTFLGPLRKTPERFYVLEDASRAAENDNRHNVALMLANDHDLVKKVNLELEHLQTGYQIKIVELTNQDSEISGVFILQFIDQKSGIAASIKDIGFGFSQILPVIAQSVISDYSNVIIEQPELHLHPALQAELGDMFIRGSLDKKSYLMKSYRNLFFIETHSEHLILRLLRRIRENSEGELPENIPPITPDDIAVLYVQPGNNGAQVIHIPVTSEGEFATSWPGGFFAERARELF